MITQERLKELLHYNSDNGVFTWSKSRRGAKAGSIAGSVRSFLSGRKRYNKIMVDRKQYLAHRLAWLYTHGDMPSEQIDHIDGNGLNNKLSNLRSVSNAENQKNRRLNANNASGVTGVHWCKSTKKWVAFICVNSKQTHIGRFNEKDEAIAAREIANKEFDYHENHGQNRPL